MRSTSRAIVVWSATLLALAPALAYPQSLANLLKLVQQVPSSDLVGAIKSFTEIVQGQVTPGAQAQDAEGKVVLYRTSWCGYCKRAASYMQQKNIPFVERDIETNPSYRAEYTRLGGKGPVPFTVFGDKTLLGFSEGAFDKNYGEFKAMLAAAPPKARPPGQDAPTVASASGLQSGDTMAGKIAGIKVFAQANKSGAPLVVIGKTDEVIYMGEERDGLYRVTTQKGEGWVDKMLVKKL